MRAPGIDEIGSLLRAADDREDIRFSTFLRLLAATGMRRGEACALRWSDIDLNGATAHVDEAVVNASGGAIVKGPKTRASIRTLALDPETAERLNALRVAQTELGAACGTSLTPDSFVFSFEPGGSVPPHPDTMSHTLTRLRERAGLAADIHLHSLRHFHATAVDSVVSEAQKQARLGWSTVQMARHYTDGVPEEDRRAAEHVGRLLTAARAATG